MKPTATIIAVTLGVFLSASSVPAQQDWPLWRGPNQDGVAPAGQNPPTSWSETQNIRWRTPLPGRGHGSPIVVGERVYIASADEDRKAQVLLAIDRDSGSVAWETVIHQGGFKVRGKLNKKASLASSTPAFDGERLFINFVNDGAAWITAVGLDGKIQWQQRLVGYVVHQGYGSSPTVYGDLVIVAADNKSGGAVVGLDRATGKEIWRHARPKKPNYPSPVIVKADQRDQLVITGCDLVTSLEPTTGKVNWEIEGATTECVSTTLTDGRVVITSGGYPDNHVSAVLADGSGKVFWRNNLRVYVPSMLLIGKHLFAVLDAGIATCLDLETGEEVWKKRLGGTFSSSPVLVGQNIYATNEEGTTFIWRASTQGYESVAENNLGTSVFASPAICGNRIYTRAVLPGGDKRQEYLFCIGE